ncbi:hypothetical protein ROZALSC1DRAFT_27584, partial [Rozella allomycis CSF55]
MDLQGQTLTREYFNAMLRQNFDLLESLPKPDGDIWALVKKLYKIRLQDEMEISFENNKRVTNAFLISQIEKTKPVSLYMCILDWLHDKASEPELVEKKNVHVGNPDDWLASTANLNDRKYVCDIFRITFGLLRKGEHKRAMEIAESYEMYWLSSMINGYTPWNYESIASVDGDIKFSGNKNRFLFKESCLKASQSQAGIDAFAKAIFGFLSGQVDLILPVCKSWEDHIWAYIHCLKEHEIDKILLSVSQITDSEDVMERYIQGYNGTIEDIIRVNQNYISHESQKWISLIISNNLESLVKVDPSKENSTRFLCHLALYLSSINYKIPDHACDDLLLRYINYLTSKDMTGRQVAFYTKFLSPGLQVQAYSNFILNFDWNNSKIDRKALLAEAKSIGLNYQGIAKLAVDKGIENAEIKFNETMSVPERPVIELIAGTEEDEQLVLSLEYLLAEDRMISDSLIRFNKIMRLFLAFGKLSSCCLLMKILPAIDRNFTALIAPEEISEDEWEVSKKEFSDYKLFLEGYSAFMDWQTCFAQKPEIADEANKANEAL